MTAAATASSMAMLAPSTSMTTEGRVWCSVTVAPGLICRLDRACSRSSPWAETQAMRADSPISRCSSGTTRRLTTSADLLQQSPSGMAYPWGHSRGCPRSVQMESTTPVSTRCSNSQALVSAFSPRTS